jgi:hypothetical protein
MMVPRNNRKRFMISRRIILFDEIPKIKSAIIEGTSRYAIIHPNEVAVPISIIVMERGFMHRTRILGNSFKEISLSTKNVMKKAYTTAIAADSVAVKIPPTTPITTIKTVIKPGREI